MWNGIVMVWKVTHLVQNGSQHSCGGHFARMLTRITIINVKDSVMCTPGGSV